MTRTPAHTPAETMPHEGPKPKISLIIPTLDEETQLAETLNRATAALGPEVEVIVVDGGSRDRTVEIAARYGTVLLADQGRGPQLRAGARAATGEILVFLHADTWLPEGSAAAVRTALRNGAGAGCFRFAVRPPAPDLRYRLLERGVKLAHEALSDRNGRPGHIRVASRVRRLRRNPRAAPVRRRGVRPGRAPRGPLRTAGAGGPHVEPTLGLRLPAHDHAALGAPGSVRGGRRSGPPRPPSPTPGRAEDSYEPASDSVTIRSTNQRPRCGATMNGTLTSPCRVPAMSAIHRALPPSSPTGSARSR